MDFITALPPANSYTVVMVVVDRLSKFAHFIPLKSDYNSKQVAEAFVNHIVKLHGFPKSIVSDRDKVFISHFWQQLFKLQGTSLAMSSSYHPQTDGQSEVLNKTLEMYLRCFCHAQPRKWLKMLPWAQFWYNTSYHHTIRMSPFKALYGREPPKLIRYAIDSSDAPEVQHMLQERDQVLEQLKKNLLRAQQYMKDHADRRRRPCDLQVGDLVLVKLQPYRQNSLALRKNQKLGLRFFGPFRIIAKLSPVAYKLELPAYAKIHSVFHISLLRKFRGDNNEQYFPLPLTTSEQGPLVTPTAILATRSIMLGQQTVPQLLVQWEAGSIEDATWENA